VVSGWRLVRYVVWMVMLGGLGRGTSWRSLVLAQVRHRVTQTVQRNEARGRQNK
jgi:hypothetical protein